jgi:hypothetical protein
MAGMAGIYSTKGVEPGSDKADDRSDEPSLRSDQHMGSILGATGPFGSVAQGESWIPYHVIPVGSSAAAYECHGYK